MRALRPVLKAPTASFTASTTSGTAPLPVQFTDTSSGAPTAWAWDFGDGSTATGATASHTYTEPGSHTITLTVTDDAGVDSTTSRQVTVLAGGGIVASDSFSEVETRWGSAEVGGAWSYVSGASTFSTDSPSRNFTVPLPVPNSTRSAWSAMRVCGALASASE